MLQRTRNLGLDNPPEPILDAMRPGVQVDSPDNRAPHVVLALAVGPVADPHRSGVLVPGQMIQRLLSKNPFPTDAVHQLQMAAFGVGDLGNEVEEIVGLPVQSQSVECPQSGNGVADPGIAIVPVAFAARSFRQRCGGGSHDCASRRE